jgi:hypothetical protein
MALVIEDPQTERLARQMALAEGVSVEEVVREGLAVLAGQGRRDRVPKPRPLRERLAALAQEVDALPPRAPVDPRSDDDILGYDERGLW